MLGPFAAPHETGDARDPAGRAASRASGTTSRSATITSTADSRRNQFYSGSLDYTSTNTWGEKIEERMRGRAGQGVHRARPRHGRAHLPPPRARRATSSTCRRSRARGLTTEEVNDAHRRGRRRVPAAASTTRSCGSSCATCRATSTRQLDHRQLRDFRRRALHFHLDTRRPEMIRSRGARRAGPPAVARRLRARQAARARACRADVDRDALVELGLRYLKDAEERESASAPAPAASVEG